MNESSRKVAPTSRPCIKTLMALAVPVKTRESTTTMTAQEKFLKVPIVFTSGEARNRLQVVDSSHFQRSCFSKSPNTTGSFRRNLSIAVQYAVGKASRSWHLPPVGKLCRAKL